MNSCEIFIQNLSKDLKELFRNNIIDPTEKLTEQHWRAISINAPLSVAIPAGYGGRGIDVKQCLRVLSSASYESLSLSLIFGINIALFLEPIAKYAGSIKSSIFQRFINDNAMGGLMITEPAHGTDALNMKTSYSEKDGKFHISGNKHWQGLTGLADFWIIAARKQLQNGELTRDLDFFVTDSHQEKQRIQVQEHYPNLGLQLIPYGNNLIDIAVPLENKLQSANTGIKMMLDILHRSRFQFAGMGMGFIKRLLDETITHCSTRKIGGNFLIGLDQVKAHISKIQAAFTLCNAFCSNSSLKSSIDYDLSNMSLEANACKALVTDMMYECANTSLQLAGANGYRLDNFIGKSLTDSRPFTIFEGSNELLYTQICDVVLKLMKNSKELNFGNFLSQFPLTSEASSFFLKDLNFRIDPGMKQREQILLGKIIARIIACNYAITLGHNGYNQELIENAICNTRTEIGKLKTGIINPAGTSIVFEYGKNSDWFNF